MDKNPANLKKATSNRSGIVGDGLQYWIYNCKKDEQDPKKLARQSSVFIKDSSRKPFLADNNKAIIPVIRRKSAKEYERFWVGEDRLLSNGKSEALCREQELSQGAYKSDHDMWKEFENELPYTCGAEYEQHLSQMDRMLFQEAKPTENGIMLPGLFSVKSEATITKTLIAIRNCLFGFNKAVHKQLKSGNKSYQNKIALEIFKLTKKIQLPNNLQWDTIRQIRDNNSHWEFNQLSKPIKKYDLSKWSEILLALDEPKVSIADDIVHFQDVAKKIKYAKPKEHSFEYQQLQGMSWCNPVKTLTWIQNQAAMCSFDREFESNKLSAIENGYRQIIHTIAEIKNEIKWTEGKLLYPLEDELDEATEIFGWLHGLYQPATVVQDSAQWDCLDLIDPYSENTEYEQEIIQAEESITSNPIKYREINQTNKQDKLSFWKDLLNDTGSVTIKTKTTSGIEIKEKQVPEWLIEDRIEGIKQWLFREFNISFKENSEVLEWLTEQTEIKPLHSEKIIQEITGCTVLSDLSKLSQELYHNKPQKEIRELAWNKLNKQKAFLANEQKIIQTVFQSLPKANTPEAKQKFLHWLHCKQNELQPKTYKGLQLKIKGE